MGVRSHNTGLNFFVCITGELKLILFRKHVLPHHLILLFVFRINSEVKNHLPKRLKAASILFGLLVAAMTIT